MAEVEFQTLLARLAERTAAGKVNWKPTANDAEFVLYFQNNALSMRMGTDTENDDFITFTLRNDAGKKIEEWWVWENRENWPLASSMWATARRSALGVDVALNALLAEIEHKEIIGDDIEPKIVADDDDLPF